MPASTDISKHLKIFDHQGAPIPDYLYHSGISESEALILSIKLPSGQKLLDPLCYAYPVPEMCWPQHNMSFILTFISFFCLILLCLFCSPSYMFVCLCLNLFLLCIHSSIVVSPDRNVGKYHPSDLIPSCMPPPYTLLHLTA